MELYACSIIAVTKTAEHLPSHPVQRAIRSLFAHATA
jgi:hypothetical protein